MTKTCKKRLGLKGLRKWVTAKSVHESCPFSSPIPIIFSDFAKIVFGIFGQKFRNVLWKPNVPMNIGLRSITYMKYKS